MAATQVENLQLELKHKLICRFCLSQSEPLTNIYSEKKKNSAPLQVQVMSCASIDVFTNDGLPNTVCDTCRMFIEHSYRFKQMCKKADTVLRQYPLTGTWTQPLYIPKMSEEFILKNHPNLCRKPKTESISPVSKNSTAESPAAQSSSGVTQKPQTKLTGKKLLNNNSNFIYQFKIILMGSNPQIWRRVQVPEKYSFRELHRAIQSVMGWTDYHMHQFVMINPETGERVVIGVPYPECGDTIPEKTALIAKYFLSPKDKASYDYDFGFPWNHDIILEKILPAVAGIQYPQCIPSKMASSPKDFSEEAECSADYFNPKLIKFDNPEEL